MQSPKLSVIIPVYNEENHIEKIIPEVQNAPIKIASEIIIVDDGSTDKTINILKKYSPNKNLKIVYLPKNKGKGAAIREGLKFATGDIILIQDADDEYSVKDYPAILEPIIQGNAQIVYGSRFLGRISQMRWQNFLANKILTSTANILYGLKITDEATAYKAFKKEVIKSLKLKCERFEFCPEVTAKVAKKGFKIQEVPITYHARNIKTGKKIRPKDAFSAFWTLIKYRFKD
jgi:glycosyltransferase involved in cell wall biosynthesis